MTKSSPRYSTFIRPAQAPFPLQFPVRSILLRSRKAPNLVIGTNGGLPLYVFGGTIGMIKMRRSSCPGGLFGGAVMGDLFRYCVVVSGVPVLSYTFVSGG